MLDLHFMIAAFLFLLGLNFIALEVKNLVLMPACHALWWCLKISMPPLLSSLPWLYRLHSATKRVSYAIALVTPVFHYLWPTVAPFLTHFLSLLVLYYILSPFSLVQHYKRMFLTRTAAARLSIIAWCHGAALQTRYPKHRENVFRNLPLPAFKRPKSHPHPNANHARGKASMFIDDFAKQCKRPIYSLSCSRHDKRLGHDGSHGYHFPKDTNFDVYAKGKITPEHVVKLVDVDYYLDDLPHQLSEHPATYLLYTLDPLYVSGRTDETAWWVTPDDELEFLILGDARYKHKLWDYANDTISVNGWLTTTTYRVDKRRAQDPLHTFVLLSPIVTIWNPFAWFGNCSLKRRTFIRTGDDGFQIATNRIIVPRSEVPDSLLSNATDASQKAKELETTPDLLDLISLSLPGSTEISLVSVAQILPSLLNPNLITKATGTGILGQLTKSPIGGTTTQKLTTANLIALAINKKINLLGGARTYYNLAGTGDRDFIDFTPLVNDPGSVQEPGKLAGSIVAPRVYPGGTKATKSYESDLVTVVERFVNVRNPENVLPQKFNDITHEFVNLCIPEDVAHTLSPIGPEEVRELQNLPSQRNKATRFWDRVYLDIDGAFTADNGSFQKNEGLQKIGAPRNIVPVNYPVSNRMSQYAIPLGDYIKTMPWYAFGLSPYEVELKVHELAKNHHYVANTDYSKWDGSRGCHLKTLVTAIMQRAFPEEYHRDIELLNSAPIGSNITTSHGVAFFIMFQMLSGSSETSLGNTLDNAFIAYLVNRLSGMTRAEAWGNLGVYGGDDGITPITADCGLFVTTAATLGVKLKIERQSTDLPIKFLGRIYLQPKTSLANIADVKRQLQKLNESSLVNVSRAEVLLNKAQSYLVTDPCTPLLSTFTKNILARYKDYKPKKPKDLLCDLSYHAREGLPFSHPLPEEIPDAIDYVCRDLAIGFDDYLVIDKMLEGDPNDWSAHWLDERIFPEATIPAIVGNNTHIVERGEPNLLSVDTTNLPATPTKVDLQAKIAASNRESKRFLQTGDNEVLGGSDPHRLHPMDAPVKRSRQKPAGKRVWRPSKGPQ